MSNTMTIDEGLKSLERIKLLMEYDLSKTYSENLYVLSEQPDSKMPFQPERFGYNPSKPETMKPSIERQQKAIQDTTNFIKNNRHPILQIAALGTMVIPLVGPFISLGLDLADAGLYYSEGDKYMAGFTLAFALIPASQLVAKIPAVKKVSKQGLVKILKFFRYGGKSGVVLSKTEKEAAEQIAKNSKWIRLTSLLNLVKSSLKVLIQKLSLRQFIKFILRWKKNNKIKYAILHATIQIGGITYTYEKLAKMLGISPTGEDIRPTVGVKTQKKLEQQFQQEKPKTVQQLTSQIEKTLTNETSLNELNQLISQSLKEDTTGSTINTLKPLPKINTDTTKNVETKPIAVTSQNSNDSTKNVTSEPVASIPKSNGNIIKSLKPEEHL